MDRAAGSLEHELERLCREHRALDEQVRALDRQRYLTDEQALERRRLQKLKLWVKDRIAELSLGR